MAIREVANAPKDYEAGIFGSLEIGIHSIEDLRRRIFHALWQSIGGEVREVFEFRTGRVNYRPPIPVRSRLAPSSVVPFGSLHDDHQSRH